VQHGGHKLVETYLTVFVHIHALQHKVKLLIGRLDALLFESSLDLVDRKVAIVVAINVLEENALRFNLFTGQLGRNKGKNDCFQPGES